MASPIETKIKDRIAEFVTELDKMVRASTLEALHGILANGATPARRGPGRPRGTRAPASAPTGRGRRPADLGDATAMIVDHVRGNDGQGIGAIAEATGVDLKTAKKAAIQLLASGQLKKSGQKRGTVYHVGSGRAPRAAKAAKRSKKAGKARRKPGAVLIPQRKRPAAKRVATKARVAQPVSMVAPG